MLSPTTHTLNNSFPRSSHALVRSSAGSLVVSRTVLNSLLSIVVSGGLLQSLLLLLAILLVLLTGDASY